MSKNFELRTKPNGVPILSRTEIDALAEQYLLHCGSSLDVTDPDTLTPTPLKVLFAGLDGFHFGRRYLSHNGCLYGLTTFEGGRMTVFDARRKPLEKANLAPNTILVDAALFIPDLEPTCRFTICHEIGHALMHRTYCSRPDNMKAYAEAGRAKSLEDETEAFSITDDHLIKNDHDWVEWQANTFAECILLPKTKVLYVAECVKKDSPEELSFLTDLNSMLCDLFHVSPTTALLRMKHLGIAPETARLAKGLVVVE